MLRYKDMKTHAVPGNKNLIATDARFLIILFKWPSVSKEVIKLKLYWEKKMSRDESILKYKRDWIHSTALLIIIKLSKNILN